MPIRNSVPFTFTGRSLSDATDATQAMRGAMRSLANLLVNPTTPGAWYCRPAAVDYQGFSDFNNPTQITALEVVGDIAWGMVSTDRFPGHDEPFAYDARTQSFLPVSNVTAANTPISPPLTGEWTPPIVKRVGTRVLVTHGDMFGTGEGFPGGAVKFGWFDISGLSTTTTGNVLEQFSLDGDTVIGVPIIYGIPPGTLPSQAQIGFDITGAGIPAGTTIVSVADTLQTFTGDTSIGSPIIANVADTTGLHVGMVVQTANFPVQSQILTIVGTNVTLDQNATVNQTGAALTALGREATISANATATADGVTLAFFSATTITGNPSIFGLQPGLVIAGTGIPAGTTIVLTALTTEQLIATITAGSNQATTNINASDLAKGMEVAGVGIAPGTTLLSAVGGTIIMSNPALLTGQTELFFTGAQIQINQDAAGTHLGETLTITGGTPAAPLWAAGDTGTNNLPSTPVGVGEMNGRAWFACGDDGIPFSDALLPCLRTNATQALIPGNGVAVTAIGELKLTSSTLGGNVQGLLAFQRDSDIQQITGDPITLNLIMADLRCATGTHAPLTIASTTKGTFFVSPQGLRLVGFSGQVSDPIGQDGAGVVQPFLNVTNPPMTGNFPASRMCAAANGRTLRITVPIQATPDVFPYLIPPDATTMWREFWYDTTRGTWTGPHLCASSVISAWSDTFLLAPAPIGAMVLRQSDDAQNPASVFVEDGVPMQWEWEPSLMPDNGMMAENAIIESAVMVALMPEENIQVDFLDEVRANLDGVRIDGLVIPPSYFGEAQWGVSFISPDSGTIRQRQLPWTTPITFKQGTVNIRGNSSPSIVIGNLYLRYEILGYMLEIPQIPAAPFGGVPFLLSNDGMTVLQSNNLTRLRAPP